MRPCIQWMQTAQAKLTTMSAFYCACSFAQPGLSLNMACRAYRFAHWWEQNDAKLAFSGRDPAESHNRTMKMMQENLLDMQHELAEKVGSVEQGLDTHIANLAADFAWLREKLQ